MFEVSNNILILLIGLSGYNLAVIVIFISFDKEIYKEEVYNGIL